MFTFVHDPEFVSGRDWRPVPASVQANMQATASTLIDEANAEDDEQENVLEKIAILVPRPLQADNKNLVVKALEHNAPGQAVQHLLPALGLLDFQVNNGHRVFFRKAGAAKEFVRLKENVRQEVRTKFGEKSVPRSRHKYKDFADPVECVKRPARPPAGSTTAGP